MKCKHTHLIPALREGSKVVSLAFTGKAIRYQLAGAFATGEECDSLKGNRGGQAGKAEQSASPLLTLLLVFLFPGFLFRLNLFLEILLGQTEFG
jgi:hypothetical protein